MAGQELGCGHLLRNGLCMLGWLLAGETRHGHLSVVPAGGVGPRRGPPGLEDATAKALPLRHAGRVSLK